MGLKSSPASKGQKTHKHGASSSLAKHKHVTKPESRHGTSHKYGVSQAESMIRKAHS